MTTATMTSEQFCCHTFNVIRGGVIAPVYIYRHEIGGGEWAYSVKAGQVGNHVNGKTLAKGFDSRKLALAWIEKNAK